MDSERGCVSTHGERGAKRYKEITAEEADMFHDVGTPFQLLYDGNAKRYVWADSHKADWKPSHYPNDKFRIEVE